MDILYIVKIYYLSFFESAKAFLKSLKEFERPYINTPPLYTLVANMANRIIDTMRMPNDNAISHTGIFNIPTRKNMTIGVKNGIYEDTVIKVVSGTDNPNMAMKNAMI